MKIINELPEDLFQNIHEQAISKLSRYGDAVYTVGIHTAKMNINGILRETIIPPVSIHIDQVTEKGVPSSYIEYRITYNQATFPLGHIYGSSGYLCLGGISVPPFISPYDLMTPLETLFIFNDRNTGHGGAHIPITREQDESIKRFCEVYGLNKIKCPKDKYVEHDVIWDLCAELLTKFDKARAFEAAEELFRIVFTYKPA